MNQWKWPNDLESVKSRLGHLLKEIVIFKIRYFKYFLQINTYSFNLYLGIGVPKARRERGISDRWNFVYPLN